MASKKNVKMFRTLEDWHTRYGKSIRVVTRTADGKFFDQVSLSSLLETL